jgi:hypothetical protein
LDELDVHEDAEDSTPFELTVENILGTNLDLVLTFSNIGVGSMN